jgi:hypothetical protein
MTFLGLLMTGKTQGHKFCWDKSLHEVEFNVGFILVKPMVEGFIGSILVKPMVKGLNIKCKKSKPSLILKKSHDS